MNKRISITPRWYGPVPTRNGKPLPMNQWARAGRKRKWGVRWYAPDGTRPRETFDSKVDAETFADTKRVEFESKGPRARIRPKRVTIGQFVAEYERARVGHKGKRLSIGTIRAYMPTLKRFRDFIGPETPLEAIRPVDLLRFIAHVRQQESPAPTTMNKYKRALKAALNVAVKPYGYLTVSPCDEIEADRVCKKDPGYVSPDEFKALVEACRTRGDRALWWEAFLMVAYTSGTRANEAVHLAWRDVDFGSDTIRIIAKPDTGTLEAWQPKDHEARTIPVPIRTMDTLTRVHAEAPEGAEYVFVSPLRLGWIAQRRQAGKWREGAEVICNLDRDFKRIAKTAGVSGVSLHTLRKACITHWAKRLPIDETQRLAGHESPKTTMDFYVSSRANDLTEARRATADALLPDPK